MWAAADQRSREAAPFLSYGSFTGFAPRDVCAIWPVPPTATPHPAVSPGPGKVVVVSTTHDPATPYQAGVDLAKQMDASLITFDGTQHTVVFNGDACVDSAVVAFLVDGVKPPAGLAVSRYDKDQLQRDPVRTAGPVTGRVPGAPAFLICPGGRPRDSGREPTRQPSVLDPMESPGCREPRSDRPEPYLRRVLAQQR